MNIEHRRARLFGLCNAKANRAKANGSSMVIAYHTARVKWEQRGYLKARKA